MQQQHILKTGGRQAQARFDIIISLEVHRFIILTKHSSISIACSSVDSITLQTNNILKATNQHMLPLHPSKQMAAIILHGEIHIKALQNRH